MEDGVSTTANLEKGKLNTPNREKPEKFSRQCKITTIVSVVIVYFLAFLALILAGVIDVGINIFSSDSTPSSVNTTRLRQTTLINLAEIQTEVNFDVNQSPYPDPVVPYDVSIPDNENCFVIFEDNTKTTYRLVTSETNPEPNNPLSFLTHETPCGVCSDLQDLATYIETPDLTDPVRNCGFTGNPLECVKAIGFSNACASIWTFNLQYTRSQCLLVCISFLDAPNNLESGGNNFCEPGTEESFQCRNTINGEPACDEFQYEEGEFRLNPCIQCDECNAGPLFQKIAGRTRRASGITSNINRPNVAADVDHNYF